MALTLSRVDRTPRTYVLADVMATVPASVDGVQVALLPPRSGPTAATVWTTVTYASGSFDVLWVGPDADASGGLVVSASADAWVKVTDAPLVEAVKLERITVLGGGASLAAPVGVPVVSVNGKQGSAVVLSAADVGAPTTTDLSTGLAGKVNSSTYTAGLAAKQDVATLGAAVVADATVRAAFDARYVQPVGNRVGLFGNSIEWQNDVTEGATNMAVHSYGYMHHAQVALGHPFRITVVQGVIGNTTAQFVARLAAFMAPALDWAVIGGCDNDPGALTADQSIANLKVMFDAQLDAGRRLIARTALPSTTYDAAGFAHVAKVNTWTKQYARQRGFIVLDGFAAIGNPSTGQPATGTTRDGIRHPSFNGAALLGQNLAASVKDKWPAFPLDLPESNQDSANLLANGMMLGGSPTPTSWSVFADAGTGSYTASKVTRTDINGGEWWQANVATPVNALQLYQTISSGWSVGQTVQLSVEFETDTDTGGSYSLAAMVNFVGAGSYVPCTDVVWSSANGDAAPPAGMLVYPRRGLFRSVPAVIPTGTTAVQPILQVGNHFTGKVRFGRAALRILG